ncbi:MAG: signal peptide peptidase [Bacteroidetes bacterium]|nr:signal peptide peptidase [Bacteroidota bacterium]
MKSFLKIVLATFVAVILASVFLFFILLGILGGIAASSSEETTVKPNSVFVLSLNGQIIERSEDNPFASLLKTYSDRTQEMGLNDILSAIKKAKTNENIKGIYLEAGSLMAAPASLREVRQALTDFKQSGKFIYAYGAFYSQGSYYIASVADKVFLNPEGMVNWHGVAVQKTFYKGTFDKLGVEMQVVRVGTYKSAVEPFITTKMSDANREQVTAFSNSIWKTVVDDVASSRRITPEQLNLFADQGISFKPAAELVKVRLVDSLLYDDGIQSYLKKKIGAKEKDDLSLVKLETMKNAASDEKISENKIAVVYAYGEIDGVNSDGISSEEMVETLAKVRKDDKIKAVVFRVNSPGGSALGSELIWREVNLIKNQKPIFVSMGDYAASGGYYISVPADMIIAQPNTLTGSIGVFGMFPNVSGLAKKVGLSFDGVKTNKYSDLPSVNQAMNPEERDLLQAYVNHTYETFVNHCATGRKMTPDAIKKIAEGRVWTGEQAKRLGLVDALGNLNDAVVLIAKKTHLSTYNIVEYPKQKSFIEKFMSSLDAKMQERVQKAQLGEYYPYLKQIRDVSSLQGIQALMPLGITVK